MVTVSIILALITSTFQFLFQTVNHLRDTERINGLIEKAQTAAWTSKDGKKAVEKDAKKRVVIPLSGERTVEVLVLREGEVYIVSPRPTLVLSGFQSVQADMSTLSGRNVVRLEPRRQSRPRLAHTPRQAYFHSDVALHRLPLPHGQGWPRSCSSCARRRAIERSRSRARLERGVAQRRRRASQGQQGRQEEVEDLIAGLVVVESNGCDGLRNPARSPTSLVLASHVRASLHL